MKRTISIIIFLATLISLNLYAQKEIKPIKDYNILLDTILIFDKSRNREIPVAIYRAKNDTSSNKKKVVVFSHGYGKNYTQNYLNYSYLTNYLASIGFFVISIQHELSNDSLLPMNGDIQLVRRPFWERGVENIHYVINELVKTNPILDSENITLIGHSNGGDMSALYPNIYPDSISKIITLDNRRVLLPRINNIKVYSLRSSDQLADEGVLPNEEEAKFYDIKIIKFDNITHNQMNDDATEEQKIKILDYIFKFMSE